MKLMSTPKSIEIEITSRCNLRCKYCSHFTSPGDVSQDLAKDEWLKFFEELNRCAVIDVTLSGGEPCYRDDLNDIIDGIVRNKMRFGILSNGTLINDKLSAFIVGTRRCNYVQISIDGSMPMTHDAFRGEGNFLKAINGIRSLQKHNAPVTVRVTIHRKNVKDLEGIARLLLEEIGLPSFSTNSASYLGVCRKNSDQVQLTIEDRTIALQTLLRLSNIYNGRISALAGPLAEARTWLKMEKARREKMERLPGGGYLTGCNGPSSKLAVRADGVIVPCTQLGHIELGRINQDNLKEIWHEHPELKRLRERHKIPLSDFEFCKGCEYINYCTGSCPAIAYTMVGDDAHPAPDSCLRLFLERGGRLPDESLFDL